MVSFLPSGPQQFYVRDPRAQTTGAINPFYQDYPSTSVNYGYGSAYSNNGTLNSSTAAVLGAIGGAALGGSTGALIGSLVVPGIANALGLGNTNGIGGTGRTYQTATGYDQNGSPYYQPSSLVDPTVSRLTGNGLPPGADYSMLPNSGSSMSPFDTQSLSGSKEEHRVIVTDPSGHLVGSSAITAPLNEFGGVLFPYTPQITFNHRAIYEGESLVHTNYEQLYYRNSAVDTIQISGKFTASDQTEARYIMAVIQFFRAATKMFYGRDGLAGTPPPILRLDGYGNLMMDHLPVACVDFNFNLPEDVDYIATSAGPSYASKTAAGQAATGNYTMVPTLLQINVGFKLVYSRTRLSNGYGTDAFVQGALITNNKAGNGGPGGFI
jgi:hypothetical protein